MKCEDSNGSSLKKEQEDTVHCCLSAEDSAHPNDLPDVPTQANGTDVGKSPVKIEILEPSEQSAKEEALLAPNSQAMDDSYEGFAREINITPTSIVRKSALANGHEEPTGFPLKQNAYIQDGNSNSKQAQIRVTEIEKAASEAQGTGGKNVAVDGGEMGVDEKVEVVSDDWEKGAGYLQANLTASRGGAENSSSPLILSFPGITN
jgi:hypothetical protein